MIKVSEIDDVVVFLVSRRKLSDGNRKKKKPQKVFPITHQTGKKKKRKATSFFLKRNHLMTSPTFVGARVPTAVVRLKAPLKKKLGKTR